MENWGEECLFDYVLIDIIASVIFKLVEGY